jgi:hypothetical protein
VDIVVSLAVSSVPPERPTRDASRVLPDQRFLAQGTVCARPVAFDRGV